MANRLTLDDFDGHVGCRHVLEGQAQGHIRNWFTTPIGGSSPLARLITYLNTNMPIAGGWNAVKVKKALASFIIDEPES
jgi:hypothetical protein